MTYLKEGTEYLDAREKRVWEAVRDLAAGGHTANNSQVAAGARLSRTMTAQITAGLRARGYLRDVARKTVNAYHWRVTDKPWSYEGR